MCGICGLAALDGAAAVDPEALARMNETLVHRGPDSDGLIADGPVGLAARRLSIIDLEHGDQPIANEDGTVHVALNGEIYNHRSLRAGLEARGHAFSTRADTEVLVHLYEENGLGFVGDLRGMFAFAIWDSRHRRLVLGRDRFGIKPLYYRARGGWLSFASELKALLRQPGFSGEIDLRALAAYLTFNSIPGPLSIFAGVSKLPPGHLLVWEGSGIRVERWCRPAPAPVEQLRAESAEVLASELRERLRDSVRAHLVADVPVGVLLSGGVDSSALAALAAIESSEPVRTFSIGFDEPSFDELAGARLIAERYGTDHHELVVKPDAVELLPAIVGTFDEPFADSSALPTYLVSKLAAGSVKVALSGEGGDELFGGYYTYVADLLADRVGPLARLARPLLERLPSSSSKASFDYKAKRFVRAAHLPPLERHHGWKEIFSASDRTELLRPDARVARFDPLDVYRERYAETAGAEPLARLQDVDLGIYLVDDLLVKTDRASMAHSLEARVPYLDPVVSELALALPSALKVRRFNKKVLLRRAVSPLVPGEIVNAKKQGFSAPVAAWLRGPLEDFTRDALSRETLVRHGYFDPGAVERLIDRHVSGSEDMSRQLWGVLCFTLWIDGHRQAGAVEATARAGTARA
jgi:asparagine synthase (glutamine-hydrolysing)